MDRQTLDQRANGELPYVGNIGESNEVHAPREPLKARNVGNVASVGLRTLQGPNGLKGLYIEDHLDAVWWIEEEPMEEPTGI